MTANSLDSAELEQALLSAILVDNGLLSECDRLEPEHFGEAFNARLFETIRHMAGRDEIASPLTIGHYLEDDQARSYAASLVADPVGIHPRSVRKFAEALFDAYRRRTIADLGNELIHWAASPAAEDSVGQKVGEIQARMDALSVAGGAEGPVAFTDVLGQALEEAAERYKAGSGLLGVATGLHELDDVLSGLVPGNLIVLAGRPGMGKSALALSIALHVARSLNIPTQFFSLEMTAVQLGQRDLAATTDLKYHDIGRGRFSMDDFHRMHAVANAQVRVPMVVDPTPGLTVESIRARTRAAIRRGPVGLIVIDHLGKIRKPNMNNDVAAIGHVTNSLAMMAKEIGTPVLLLSQLNRAVDARDDKRPGVPDLRGSGNIEEDADSILFLYRHHYYVRTPPSNPAAREKWHADKNICEVNIAKNRHGPAPQTVRVYANMATGKFASMSRRDDSHLQGEAQL